MDFTLIKIGYIDNDNELIIRLDNKYQRALINVEKFSHLHVFYLDQNEIKDIIVKIKSINLSKGILVCENNYQNVNLFSKGKYELIDIKPYMPSEDSINYVEKDFTNDHCKRNIKIVDNNIKSIGLIRNVKGLMYLELDETIEINDTYLKVFWWFDKFDKPKLRELTMCNPPYEDAPQSGVFATRSPVRPNLIAMTIVKVVKKDDRLIYVNGIEGFDKTPIIGLCGYDINKDYIDNSIVPSYLAHWPKYIDFSDWNKNLENIEIKNSRLFSLLYSNKEYDTNRDLSFNRNIENKYSNDGIIIVNAHENNLKNVNITIPYSKINAIIGVSGSGKSSLVDDTIYKECQRRMEYLNRNRALFVKPNVDAIKGVLPAIRIKQDPIRGSIMSTVGTYTNSYEPLRILFSTIGLRHCPECGEEIIPLTEWKIEELITKNDLDIYDINKNQIKLGLIKECVHKALEDGLGALYTKIDDEFVLLQTKEKCYHCNKIMFNLTPSTFSYLNTEARCPICNGRGEINEVDVEKIVTNKNISLLDGAIGFYGKLSNFINNPNANWMKGQVVALALDENVDLSIPWKDLPDGFKHELLYGVDKIVTFPFFNKRNGRTRKIQRKVEGLVPLIKRLFNEETDPKVIDRYFSKKICPSCNNERLNKEGRMVTICNVRYPVASNYTFKEMLEFINEIETEYSEKELNKVRSCISALKEITLCSSKLGIDYLSLGQSTATLSTGESQRIKLLGAYLNHMSHILYIFDEPSKGLDARDYTHVMNMMKALKEENNTIIMVEHNIDMIKLADNIIEIGPKAGKGGGNIIGEGTFEELLKNKNTELSKCNSIKRITSEHDISDMVTYSGLNKNYLKNISISFPRNAITSIYGVSGSGKSTLLRKEIYPRALEDKKFDDCILVDSTPIGKNNKSIIATYVGIMDEIRTLFACTEQAKEANMDEKYFSFNQEEGCCSKCNGDGRIELEFFKDTFIKCPDCDGTRYNDTVLKIKYQNKNINEVLNLSILEALDFFINNNELNTICIKLEFLKKVGLGYLKIGDTTSSLSGGEASRLKLAKELMKGKKKNTLYLLDEPTIGLHFSDIDNLLLVINELAKDNTILAIEHNKQFLMNSDYYIELGPGAGILGGEVVYQGNKNNI